MPACHQPACDCGGKLEPAPLCENDWFLARWWCSQCGVLPEDHIQGVGPALLKYAVNRTTEEFWRDVVIQQPAATGSSFPPKLDMGLNSQVAQGASEDKAGDQDNYSDENWDLDDDFDNNK